VERFKKSHKLKSGSIIKFCKLFYFCIFGDSMANDFFNLITQISNALLSAKNQQKSGYKPKNAENPPSTFGDFTTFDKNVISPKNSVVEMIKRHDQLSKKIDKQNSKQD